MKRQKFELNSILASAIVWHPTTLHRFECQAGCVCCCVNTLFFPSEVEGLPAEVRACLTLRQGLIQPQRRSPGVCVFFDEGSPWHCRIFQHRPLRCRLYPYLPLISDEGIVIVADPLCTVSWPETDYPVWFRCYGLGRGPDVVAEVEAMSREFLSKMMDKYPHLVWRHLHVKDVEDWINWKEVEKHHHPLYPKWNTETIRRAARLDLEMESQVRRRAW